MYVFSRRQVAVAALILVATAVGLGALGVHFSTGVRAAKIDNPAIYQGSSGQKAVAFNFNVDWGEDYLPPILEELNKEGIKATFFVTGRWAEKNPDLVRSIASQGHLVENHGYRHSHVAGRDIDTIGREIADAEDIIEKITGRKPVFFAPPYGEVDRNVLAAAGRAGYRVVMWSLDTIDWQRPPSSAIVERVVKRAHNDAIILMHPTEPTCKALPVLIRELKDQGYKIVPLANLVEASETGGGKRNVALGAR